MLNYVERYNSLTPSAGVIRDYRGSYGSINHWGPPFAHMIGFQKSLHWIKIIQTRWYFKGNHSINPRHWVINIYYPFSRDSSSMKSCRARNLSDTCAGHICLSRVHISFLFQHCCVPAI